MFILFHLSKMDIKYLYTNLFKYLGDGVMNEDELNEHMEQALTSKYSHVTYNKDERCFIENIL